MSGHLVMPEVSKSTKRALRQGLEEEINDYNIGSTITLVSALKWRRTNALDVPLGSPFLEFPGRDPRWRS